MAPELLAQVAYEAQRASYNATAPAWRHASQHDRDKALQRVRDVLASPKALAKEDDEDSAFRQFVLSLADGI